MPTHKDLPLAEFEKDKRHHNDVMQNFILLSNGIIEENIEEAFSLGVDQVVIDIMGAEDDPAYASAHFTVSACSGVLPRNERAGKFQHWINMKKLL